MSKARKVVAQAGREGKTEKEQRKPTATQLFAKYMRAVDKVRGLAMALAEETRRADELSTILANEFGIGVTGSRPRQASAMVEVGAAATQEEEEAGAEGGYKPPPQYHADATKLSGRGSQEVADIRRDAGLDVAAGDSEELASQGVGMMAQLQSGMKGTPAVVAAPGAHGENRGVPQERSNAGGGPVRQGPTKE